MQEVSVKLPDAIVAATSIYLDLPLRKEYNATLKLKRKPLRPELWDGHTAERCVEAIVNYSA